MIRASAEFFSRIMQRWLPDTFVIAIILTAVVFLAGMVTQGQGIGAMADHWGNGVWKLLGFSMQMVLILVLGTVLAMSRPVKAALRAIARMASTPSQGIILVTLTSMMALWVNWGFGLVVGALLAREVASHVKNSHFPLLIAAAYSGLLVWHSGLSGSIPLKIASTGDDALSQLLNGQTVPLLETIFAWQNIAIIIALAISLPILNILMMPDKNNRLGLAAEEEPEPAVDLTAMSPAEKLEHYPIINYLLVVIGAVYLFGFFSSGRSISLNEINLCLLLAGLALHINRRNYLNARTVPLAPAVALFCNFPSMLA